MTLKGGRSFHEDMVRSNLDAATREMQRSHGATCEKSLAHLVEAAKRTAQARSHIVSISGGRGQADSKRTRQYWKTVNANEKAIERRTLSLGRECFRR